MSDKVFTMAGDVGDAVYALPVVKALGGGHLVFWSRPYVRDMMSPAKVEKIATFFASQPYVFTVQFKTHEPDVTHNLDDFRATWLSLRRQRLHLQYNLAELHLLSQNLPLKHAAEQWLTIEPAHGQPEPAVIFSRSPRYRNRHVDWKAAYEKYSGVAVFLGLPEEYREFCGNVGQVPYLETPTLLEAAQLIATSKLVVANQNALAAVAIGLKKKLCLEVWVTEANCIFPGVLNVWDDKFNWPDL